MKWLTAREISATEMRQRPPPTQTLNSDYIVSRNERILVTGSSGFIGSRVVETSRIRLYQSSLFCSTFQPAVALKETGEPIIPARDVELVTGDLLSCDDCRKGRLTGVSIIYHLAAGMDKVICRAIHDFGGWLLVI